MSDKSLYGKSLPEPTPDKPALHPNNILGSPGSTWAGAAAILAVLAGAMSKTGFPTTTEGWIGFGVAVATGIGAIFSRA